MTRQTHERMNELNPMSANRNLLKELHDTIYQWAETIPNGGVQVDISNALVSTYESYQRQEAAEKERRAKEREAESLSHYLADEDYNYDDDIYDDDYDSDDTSYDDEDSEYDSDYDDEDALHDD